MKFGKLGWVSWICLMIALLLAGVVIYQSWVALNDDWAARLLVSHTQEVLMQAQRIEVDLVRAESGQRGYLITGNPVYIDRELTAATLDHDIDRLQQLITDNPVQQNNIALLRPLVRQRMERLAYDTVLYGQHRQEAARARIGSDKDWMLTKHIRLVMADIKQEENGLLRKRTENWHKYVEQTQVAFVVINIIVVVSLVTLGIGLLQARARASAANLLRLHAETRLTSILESIPGAIYMLDLDLRFTYVNSTAEKMLQRSRQELIGNTLAMAYSEQVASQLHEQYKLALLEQRSHCFEIQDVSRDQWVSVIVTPEPEGLSITFSESGELQLSDEAEIKLLALLRQEL